MERKNVMSTQTTITFALNDPPYETPRTATALRLIERALALGHNVNVFAYEGAVAVPFTRQKPHGNGVHDRNVEEEDHPLTHEWVEALLDKARKANLTLDWVNCGLCVDERGVLESVEGTRRGGPPDFGHFVESSTNTLVIPTR